MNRYWLCGWRVISDFQLPELRLRDDQLPHDVAIRTAELPDTLEDVVFQTPFCTVTQDGAVVVTVAAVARFFISKGAEILIEPAQGALPSAVRLLLWDMALAILCRQRGLFPLHASCVAFEGEAVALAGSAASGKSCLAFALAARSHRVLADDVTVIDASAPDGPVVIPAVSFVTLWRDFVPAAESKGTPLHSQPELMRPEMGKYQIRIGNPPAAREALPLRAVFTLESDSMARRPRIERIVGLEAIRLTTSQVSLRRALLPLWPRELLFRESSRIAAHARIGRLSRRHDFADSGKLANLLETAVEQPEFPL